MLSLMCILPTSVYHSGVQAIEVDVSCVSKPDSTYRLTIIVCNRSNFRLILDTASLQIERVNPGYYRVQDPYEMGNRLKPTYGSVRGCLVDTNACVTIDRTIVHRERVDSIRIMCALLAVDRVDSYCFERGEYVVERHEANNLWINVDKRLFPCEH